MPDIKLINYDATGNIEFGFQRFNDSVSGIYTLAQTAVLMLLDPNYGNFESLLKQRLDTDEIGEIVLRSVDNVERIMIDEQIVLDLPEDEILKALDIVSVVVEVSEMTINLSVSNKLGEEQTVTI